MTMLPFFMYRLRSYDVFQFRFDFKGREAGGVPSAADGFDEKDAGNQLLAADYSHLLFVIKQILLSVDDIEVADEAAGVAALRDGKRAACGIDGVLLRFLGFVQNQDAVHVVLHLAEGV